VGLHHTSNADEQHDIKLTLYACTLARLVVFMI